MYKRQVDSFDTHAKIPEHFAQVDAAAKEGGKVAMISVGWDPGMFSLNRLYANAILRDGSDYTFWGKGDVYKRQVPILIAEDSPLLNKLIVDSLKAAGYVNLIHTENGQKAYDVITQCKEDGTLDQHVRCIITDIEMPEMDGHRLTKLVKSDDATKDIPIIIFSSLVNDDMKSCLLYTSENRYKRGRSKDSKSSLQSEDVMWTEPK